MPQVQAIIEEYKEAIRSAGERAADRFADLHRRGALSARDYARLTMTLVPGAALLPSAPGSDPDGPEPSTDD